jgi:hypothetical protein
LTILINCRSFIEDGFIDDVENDTQLIFIKSPAIALIFVCRRFLCIAQQILNCVDGNKEECFLMLIRHAKKSECALEMRAHDLPQFTLSFFKLTLLKYFLEP